MPTKGLKRGAMNCATTNGRDSEIAPTEYKRRVNCATTNGRDSEIAPTEYKRHNELRDYERSRFGDRSYRI